MFVFKFASMILFALARARTHAKRILPSRDALNKSGMAGGIATEA